MSLGPELRDLHAGVDLFLAAGGQSFSGGYSGSFLPGLAPERGDTRDSRRDGNINQQIMEYQMHQVTKALVIADPWIGLIIDGYKTWEMRSRSTNIRGRIGLIRKGTGKICGVANLVSCGDPLTPDEMIHYFAKHRIPETMIRSGQVAKWNRPWMLEEVRSLGTPVPYKPKPGAVIWVSLDAKVVDAINHQITV